MAKKTKNKKETKVEKINSVVIVSETNSSLVLNKFNK